jgi:nicotinate-nucleotide adenylyltransferase
MERVVIFGGSFNPVTLGHGTVVNRVLEAGFDRVVVMPCYRHYFEKENIPACLRLEMCRRMFSGFDRVEVSDFEIKNKLSGPTIELVRCILEKGWRASNELYFLIGTDNANSFDKWNSPDELREKMRFLVLERPGEVLIDAGTWCLQKPHAFLPLGDQYRDEISSSLFRKFYQEDLTRAQVIVHSLVWNFIQTQGLY